MKNIEKNNEEKILDATLRVIESHTISGTRISLIAKEADMLQSNVLYYYKTKEEILVAMQRGSWIFFQSFERSYVIILRIHLNQLLKFFLKMKRIFSRTSLNTTMQRWISGYRAELMRIPEHVFHSRMTCGDRRSEMFL